MLQIPTRTEIGERIRMVRRQSGLTGRQMGAALGSTDPGLANKLESGKSLTYERIFEVANTCAGQGGFEKTSAEEIVDFLLGRVDSLQLTLNGSSAQMSYLGNMHNRTPRPVSSGSSAPIPGRESFSMA